MNGFTFFKNYYEAISDPENNFTEEEIGRLYNAIFAYVFEDKLLPLSGPMKAIFTIMKISLDRSKRNGKNSEKGDCEGETESISEEETPCEEEEGDEGHPSTQLRVTCGAQGSLSYRASKRRVYPLKRSPLGVTRHSEPPCGVKNPEERSPNFHPRDSSASPQNDA